MESTTGGKCRRILERNDGRLAARQRGFRLSTHGQSPNMFHLNSFQIVLPSFDFDTSDIDRCGHMRNGLLDEIYKYHPVERIGCSLPTAR